MLLIQIQKLNDYKLFINYQGKLTNIHINFMNFTFIFIFFKTFIINFVIVKYVFTYYFNIDFKFIST